MDTLAAMQVFVQVVDTGGLSAAGRTLGLAPSSISRRIGELEEMLGVRLLHRTTRRLSLTEAGETYYERSQAIVDAVTEANLAVTQGRAAPSGLLRVTVPASIARLQISPAIAVFQAQHPAVRVAVSVTDRLADIVGEGLDMAIRVGELEDSSMIARKVGAARRLVCGAPSYLKRAGRPEHPSDLSGHACLAFRTHPGTNLWHFADGESLTEIRAKGPFTADDGGTLVAAACAGLGLVLVPEWLVGPEIVQGRLVIVLTDYTPAPAHTPIYAMYPPGPHIPPKVRAFIDFLVARFSPEYDWRAPAP